ncbi:MAG TPA: hypothetical protein DEO38_06570, partial [Bacteroidales bacterium]|nr:hypothetical protein [Bacteroidales bacterium]
VYIAGEFNTWSFTAMTKVDDTHYTVTIANATAAHKYKYTCGNDWAYVEMSAEGTDVADRSYSENDVVERWNKIPSSDLQVGLTFNVTVPEGTPAVYICGGWDWNTFMPMTKVDDTHYTITIAEANSDHGYKYTCGESWTYEEEGHTANRSYSENDVVTGWKQTPTGLNTVSVTSYTIANRTLSVTLNGRQNIALYDVAGRMIQNAVVADFYQVELPVGIYILRAANTSIKVAIR